MTADRTLGELWRAAGLIDPLPGRAAGVRVAGLDYHSKRVGEGYVFFAFPGAQADGAAFAGDAVSRGAVAVVSQAPAPSGFDAPWVRVSHGRKTLALLSRAFYADAARNILLTGTTGTNGKTTTSCLLDTILRTAGHTTALVGTIEYHIAGQPMKAVNTTPESVDLYRILDRLRAAGGRFATMEVSSHALALGRVWGVTYHTAVWTNFSLDHLDFHATEQAYFDAKCELFRGQAAPPPRHAVLNADDARASQLPILPATETLWYGTTGTAELRAESIEAGFGGLNFDMSWRGRRQPVRSPLVGRINVANILAACGAALTYGISLEAAAEGIAARRAVPGRFERVECGQPFLVAVDYAHTEDAVARTIREARALAQGRVITLFGCGGDRDRTKRPRMGQAAGELSDFVVLTSDNPRSEDPARIIEDALAGLAPTGTRYHVEPDRATAIRAAITGASGGDVVLVLGKGHETYQVLSTGTVPFDDREEARQALAGLGYTG